MCRNPKVSIIIPVYNGANYIREAVDSALNQTYSNIEVIVVNDGSNDNTEEIVLSFGNRVRYFYKENGGVASALNLGIQNMQGEYFSWLSHDDIYLNNKIEKQMEWINKSGDKHKVIFGAWYQMIMPNREIRELSPEYRFTTNQMQHGVFPVFFGLIYGCTVLFHRDIISEIGYFDEKLITAQDYDYWFRLFRGRETLYIKEPLVIQRIHSEQGSNTIPEFMANCEDIQIDMVQRLRDSEVDDIFGGRYKFYYDMYRFSEQNGWNKCMDYFYHHFLEEPENESVPEIGKTKGQRLILFCAGRNGRKLRKELFCRGTFVDFFCDNNSKLWNQMIEGVECLPPSEIRNDDMVIVTNDDSKEIYEQLKVLSIETVLQYKEIANKVFSSMPLKKMVQILEGQE